MTNKNLPFNCDNGGLCQLSALESSKLKKAIKVFREVGKLHSKSEIFSTNNFKIKQVK